MEKCYPKLRGFRFLRKHMSCGRVILRSPEVTRPYFRVSNKRERIYLSYINTQKIKWWKIWIQVAYMCYVIIHQYFVYWFNYRINLNAKIFSDTYFKIYNTDFKLSIVELQIWRPKNLQRFSWSYNSERFRNVLDLISTYFK